MAELAGPSTDALTDLAKFNHEVKRVAILMCEELGLDPNRVVDAPRIGTLTPREGWAAGTDDRPMNAFLSQHVPAARWESYRRQAAISLATFRAINKYILTEA